MSRALASGKLVVGRTHHVAMKRSPHRALGHPAPMSSMIQPWQHREAASNNPRTAAGATSRRPAIGR
jgi:hypothetical protein